MIVKSPVDLLPFIENDLEIKESMLVICQIVIILLF